LKFKKGDIMISIKYKYHNSPNTWDRIFKDEETFKEWYEIFKPFITVILPRRQRIPQRVGQYRIFRILRGDNMQTITKQYNVYKYEELNEKAKEKVLNYFRESNMFDFLDDDLKELLKDSLQTAKIKYDTTLLQQFSLSNCQGDGYSFTGRFTWGIYTVYIDAQSRYLHKYGTCITIKTRAGNDASDEVHERFKTLYYSICDRLEKDGYGIIEDQNAEEYIKETIDANDYLFLEDGTIFKR
jgi:hypothetical protein